MQQNKTTMDGLVAYYDTWPRNKKGLFYNVPDPTHQKLPLIITTATTDWLIEHGFTSAPTQYRLYGRRFYRSDDPTNSVKALNEGG